jgi:hypothetical protein
MSDDDQAARQAVVVRFLAAVGELYQREQEIERHEKRVEELRAEMPPLNERVQQCYQAANLFGFDLIQAAVAYMGLQDQGPIPGDIPVERAPAPLQVGKPFSIKDFILAEGKQAHPHPVRASDLRKKLEALGHAVHEKTVGMTLYRLLRKGYFTRDKRDWLYVPDDQRGTQNKTPSDDQSEGALDFTGGAATPPNESRPENPFD